MDSCPHCGYSLHQPTRRCERCFGPMEARHNKDQEPIWRCYECRYEEERSPHNTSVEHHPV